jgi:hypothetical protein
VFVVRLHTAFKLLKLIATLHVEQNLQLAPSNQATAASCVCYFNIMHMPAPLNLADLVLLKEPRTFQTMSWWVKVNESRNY